MGQLLTFEEMVNTALGVTKVSDATTRANIERNINTAASKFMAVLGRAYTRASRSADLADGQQYYQYPEDALKLRNVLTHIASIQRDLVEIVDENYWNQLNRTAVTGLPSHFHIKGFDEVGLYPAPADDTTGGLELVFTRRHVKMTKDDYDTGTVTVVNGSQTVAGSGTVFTGMEGRAFELTDGSDGNWYRVQSVESATSMTLENYYQGPSTAGAAYRIGECPYIPEEYLQSLMDYALGIYFDDRGDDTRADRRMKRFNNDIEECRSLYSSASDHNVFDATPPGRDLVSDQFRSNVVINT